MEVAIGGHGMAREGVPGGVEKRELDVPVVPRGVSLAAEMGGEELDPGQRRVGDLDAVEKLGDLAEIVVAHPALVVHAHAHAPGPGPPGVVSRVLDE
jgi:hypothetical protein